MKVHSSHVTLFDDHVSAPNVALFCRITSNGIAGHEEEHEHICMTMGDRDGTDDRGQSQTCTEAQADGQTQSSLEIQMEATELSALSHGHCGSSRPDFGVPGATSGKT